MAANHIPIDTTKRLGVRLRRGVDLTREVLTILGETKAIMEAQIDGASYSAVEEQYGLPAGKGQTTYNTVVAAYNAIKSNATTQMVDWLG